MFQEHGAAVPVDCPLHEAHDVYGIQEGNKTEEYAARWRCELCGKAFYTEAYLDKHFENKHDDMVLKVRESTISICYTVFACTIVTEY